jgi:lysozyme family protein
MTYQFTPERAQLIAHRWDNMHITRQKAIIEYEAKEIIKHRATYTAAQNSCNGVPWWLIGMIDDREGGIEVLCHRQLGQGDSLLHYSHHEPRGRPHVGHGPPFTWMECAVDALHLQGLHRFGAAAWSIEFALHQAEPYNGLGYWMRGHASPYIWSCTTIYDPPWGPGGKYVADGEYNPHVVDSQCGVAPVLKRIEALTGEPFPRWGHHAEPVPVPDPRPQEDDLDVKWLQQSLNKVLNAKLDEDGDYGPHTKDAVRLLQQRNSDPDGHPLDVDGIAGPKTLAVLRQALEAM